MTKKKRRMTDEYMDNMWADIERRMKDYDANPTSNKKLIIDCMITDYEAKMKLKLQQNETI
jgi:hypothetical protein